MSKRGNFALFIMLLILSTASIVVSFEPATAQNGKTLAVPRDFSSINAAVGSASQGDTILVKNGIYRENVIIDKPVSLVGEDKTQTVIDGLGAGTVVWITSDGASLTGFTVQNSGDKLTDSGIYVNSSQSVILSGNLVTANNIGIYLSDSANNTLKDNSLSGNKFNFGVYSSNFEGYIQNIDLSNTVEGKPIVYWVNTEGKQAPSNAGYIAAVNCTDITVSNVALEKNWQNILFAYTCNSLITDVTSTLGEDSVWLIESRNCLLQNNNITGNIWGGIAFVNSSGCTIQSSTMKGNGGYGLFLSDSSDNRFFHNNFVDNPHQAWLYGVNSNSWDNGYPNGGNYWNNYTGVDQKSGPYQNQTGSDGIGDTPVVIAQNNHDNYPLMAPYSQQPLLTPLQFEFSLMGAIAVVSVFVIFVAYYLKNRKKTEPQRGS
jgi:parallel beta-helix repeat protein